MNPHVRRPPPIQLPANPKHLEVESLWTHPHEVADFLKFEEDRTTLKLQISDARTKRYKGLISKKFGGFVT